MTDLSAQMRRRDSEMVPLILVRAMFALMAFTLILVFGARLTDRPLMAVPVLGPVAAEATFFMEGDRQGIVTVRDSAGAVLAMSNEDKNGFLGVVWRAVERERMLRGVGAGSAYTAVRRDNGRIAVLDPSTGWSVELMGYGPDNVAAFAKLIDAQSTKG